MPAGPPLEALDALIAATVMNRMVLAVTPVLAESSPIFMSRTPLTFILDGRFTVARGKAGTRRSIAGVITSEEHPDPP